MDKRNRYRIATTEAGLAKGLLWVRYIPPPSVAPYRDHTAVVGKSDGSNQPYGYKNITVMWDKMTTEAGFYLKSLVDSARSGSGLLFMTINREDGSGPGGDWIDVSGRPGHLVLTGAGPVIREGHGTHDNVTLTINNLTVVNDPSNYST